MTEPPPFAGFFAARKALGQSSAELLAWSTRRWESWLDAQRDVSTPPAELIAVARLTCLDDLPLHIGLMQLLKTSGLGVAIVLTFPSSEMLALGRAQARRAGWHGLVHFRAEPELAPALARLPGNTWIARFPVPLIFDPSDLDRLNRALQSEAAEPEVFQSPSALCRASALGESQAGSENFSIEEIRCLVSQDPNSLPVLASRNPPRAPLVEAQNVANFLDCQEGSVALPLSAGPEVFMMAVQRDNEWTAIVRQRTDLLRLDRSLDIRVPASCLTVEAKPVRLETRGRDGIASRNHFMFHVLPTGLRPWMLSAFLNRGGAGNSVIRAFAEGVGCRIAFAEDEPDELQDVPVVWGVLRDSDRILAQARAQGLYFFYIDHAYFNRGHGKTYRITRNGYEAGPIRKCPGDRIAALDVDTRAWRKAGREIIVCPPTDFFMQAHGCSHWLEDTLETLRRVTDRPIVVRAKPQPAEQSVPLPQALETAHALVTHSSNVAIEAACLGTPVFVAPESAAAPVGLTDLSLIEAPSYPDRDQWLAHLAYSQFSFDEIRDGTAWRMLIEAEGRDFV